jgi:hypothetical protein
MPWEEAVIFNPYLHPEFGYLGAAPRLRRELRVAVFAGLFGIVIGAATVIAMSSGDRNGNSTTRAGAITTQAGPAPSVASVGNAPAPPGADLASSSQAKSSSIKAHPLTAPNGPEIARMLLGRAAAPTVAAAPAEPAAPGSDLSTRAPIMPAPAPTIAPAPAVAPVPRDRVAGEQRGTSERPYSVPVTDPKPHKITRVEKPSHKERSDGAPAAHAELENNNVASVSAAYARASSYPRTVFWEWSR